MQRKNDPREASDIQSAKEKVYKAKNSVIESRKDEKLSFCCVLFLLPYLWPCEEMSNFSPFFLSRETGWERTRAE